VRPEIKFCGMTRVEDVTAAVAIGADYIGVIFAGGPRNVSLDRAQELVRHAPRPVQRVGVFGPGEAVVGGIGEVARSVGLDVVQLHGDPDATTVEDVRRSFDGAVWAAVRVAGTSLPASAAALFRAADAVVIDAYSASSLGGTGLALPWLELADSIRAAMEKGTGRFVLAGGLRPETVSSAVAALRPDVVDVSSGVESAPGIKDHGKLRSFRDAVRGRGDRA
jgi:phosphoribosylanthranilate isomerase